MDDTGTGATLGRPRRFGPMGRREARLAYAMLMPTLLIVFAIVLFPLLANFWISVKPVELADLRPPTPIASERVRGRVEGPGDKLTIEYRLRNSSQKSEIRGVVLEDTLPPGVTVSALDARCRLDGARLLCRLGDWPGGFRDRLRIEATVAEPYFISDTRPRDSDPIVTGASENVLTNFDFTLQNFRKVFDATEFWTVLRVTIYYTVFGTLGTLVFGLFAALLLNTTFRGRAVLRGLFLFPYVAPVIAVAFTWVILFDPFSGTLNALLTEMDVIDEPVNFFGVRAVPIRFLGLTVEFPLALSTVIAFEAWRYFPLSFLFILARMQSIPSDMYEAAEVDGASPFQIFWFISLPQLAGIISVLFLLRFIWTFNKFDDIFLLTGGAAGTRTLTVDVYERGFALANLGAGAAVAVVIFVVLFVFSMVYFRVMAREEGL